MIPSFPSHIPVYIIAFNNLTFVQRFVSQVRRLTQKIVILDNHSSYQPLLEWYDLLDSGVDNQVSVIRFAENYGHSIVDEYKDQIGLPDVFVLSDPDLEISDEMPDDAIDRMFVLSVKYQRRRVGLALSLADSHLFIPEDQNELVNWEEQFWEIPIEDSDYQLFVAPIDTTFHLRNYSYHDTWYLNLRIAGPYSCRHLPWYDGFLRDNVPRAELEAYYHGNISSSIAKKHKLDFFLDASTTG
jgi:hypothetical protein